MVEGKAETEDRNQQIVLFAEGRAPSRPRHHPFVLIWSKDERAPEQFVYGSMVRPTHHRHE